MTILVPPPGQDPQSGTLPFHLCSEPILFPADVARLKAELNRDGYDASDADIQWAYSAWSEDTACASWLSMPKTGDVSTGLRSYLVPAD